MPKVRIYALGTSDGSGCCSIGDASDRGCVGCAKVAKDGDLLVTDARGRYWHENCLAQFAADIERRDEARLTVTTCELPKRNIAGGYKVVERI